MQTSNTTIESFIHRFEPATQPGKPALLLLHGTSGNEDDLMPLGRAIAPGHALLSPRGKVLENGMPRFFRRFAEGRFDEADVKAQAHALADFVEAAKAEYSLQAPIAVGFSNGANIAAAMLLLRPEAIGGAVLLRAMMPLENPPENLTGIALAGMPILLVSGTQDTMIPAAGSSRLADHLGRHGARVDHRQLAAGHGLTQQDVNLAAEFIASFRPNMK